MLVFIRIQLALRLSPGYILHTYSSLNGVESRPQSVTLAAHIGIKRSELIFLFLYSGDFFALGGTSPLICWSEMSTRWTERWYFGQIALGMYWGSRRWKKSSLGHFVTHSGTSPQSNPYTLIVYIALSKRLYKKEEIIPLLFALKKTQNRGRVFEPADLVALNPHLTDYL